MDQEPASTPEEGRAIIVAALFAALPTDKQAEILRRKPKEMGRIAGILSQTLHPEELALIAPPKEVAQRPDSQPTGSSRFSGLRKFVARIPLVRRLL